MGDYEFDDVDRRCGVVTAKEAMEILSRFCASHFRDDIVARISIPPNPDRDDDLRLRAFIQRVDLIERTARRLCEALGEDDKPRAEAIDEMRRVLGMEPWR